MKSHELRPPAPYVGWGSRIDWHSPELAALVAYGFLPKGRALDVGCGHGSESLFLADMGWNVVAIDHDAKALRLARARRARASRRIQERVEFRHCDLLDFKPQPLAGFALAVDRLLMTNLEAGTQVPSVIGVIAQALKKDGLYIIRTGLHEHPVRSRIPFADFFQKGDLMWLNHYFEPLCPFMVGYQGLVTPSHDGETRVVANYPMAIAVLRRRGTPWSAKQR